VVLEVEHQKAVCWRTRAFVAAAASGRVERSVQEQAGQGRAGRVGSWREIQVLI
jgi:hypothetical protein